MKFEPSPETFLVEEIAAYAPCGAGEHTFLWVEKHDLTTPEAVRRIARALRVADRDVGYAGMKDRHATTRQWISVPRVAPEQALALSVDGLVIRAAARHGNKLRTGHLRGNRFEAILTDVSDADETVASQRLSALGREGLPNRYGDQRFGAAGDNAAAGLALARGAEGGGERGRGRGSGRGGRGGEPDRRHRRLLLSALQSAVFNRVLVLRAAPPGLRAVRAGDVLQKTDTGGLFITDDPAADQARVDAGAVVPTGPLPGSRVLEPPDGTPARALEDQALADVGAARRDLEGMGRELPGTRRPVLVPVTIDDPPTVRRGDRLTLRFSLPAGSYATVLLQAVLAESPC